MTLAACPDSPNCVSTMADPDDSAHYIEPLAVNVSASAAIEAAENAVTSLGGRVVQKSDDRLEAVFVTKFLRFKDDVNFYFDADTNVLHFRSASRVGHSDLGANRKRMNALVPLIKAAM